MQSVRAAANVGLVLGVLAVCVCVFSGERVGDHQVLFSHSQEWMDEER
jgi:hypothetical protein